MTTPFPLPLVFTAWGFRSGGYAWSSGAGLADLCRAHGIRTVAVQQGAGTLARAAERFGVRPPRGGQPWTTPEDIAPLRASGVRVALWGVASASGAVQELQRLGLTEDDWLPQVEGPDQRDLVLDAADHGLRAPAIVTNYSGAGDSPIDVEQLRGAGVCAVFVECYNDAGIIEPYIDLDRMLWQGTKYGWDEDELFAAMGTYHGETPDDYTGTESLARDFGMYLAEPMSPAQWTAFGALNPPPPEPIEPEDDDMEPVTDTEARTAVGFAVQAAAQNWESDKPRARLTVARRICDAGNDDAKWNSCRDEIVAALDRAGVPD